MLKQWGNLKNIQEPFSEKGHTFIDIRDVIKDYENLLKNYCLELCEHYIGINVTYLESENLRDMTKDYENLLKSPCLALHDHYMGLNLPYSESEYWRYD